MDFGYVNLKPPNKRFKKGKDTGEVHVIGRIVFEGNNIEDKTLV